MSQLAKVFEVKWQAFNLSRGVTVLLTLLLPYIVLAAIGLEKYWLVVSFAALLVEVGGDPGGDYADRVQHMAVFAVIGALLTLLGFSIGGDAWGYAVLATFVITLLAGLAVKFGLHRFAAAILLNIWFVVMLTLPDADQLAHIQTSAWGQTLAWLVGAALAIAYTFIVWLVRGRTAQQQPAAELIPGSTAPVPLTRPVILFAVLRAVALSVAIAIAFGLHQPNADWMPISAAVAMKPSLQQSTLVASQRLAGAILGAAVAALFLLTVHNKYALEAVIIILGGLAGSMRTVSYALYTATTAALVLILADVPHPSNLAEEARRVLFTFIGVGIAVIVMFLASLLQKHTAQKAPAAPAATSRMTLERSVRK